jgi:hypothetical protein
MRVRVGCIVALLCALHVSASAAPTEAEKSFERGRALLAEGKFDAACAAFEASLRLDFQFGTLFNLADCNDKRGKLATSLALWKRIADEDHNSGRAQRARELAAAMDKRVPRLQIKLTPAEAGATMTLDGLPADALTAPLPIDLGMHKVAVTLPDHRVLEKTIEVKQEAERVNIELATKVPLGPPQPPVDPQQQPGYGEEPPPAAPRSSGRATAGKVLVGVGGASLVTGAVFGVLAMTGWSEAEDTAQTDVAGANDRVDRVRLHGNLATGLIAVGAVSVGVGVYLWRSGSRQVRATMAVRGDRASLGMLVTF